MAQLHSSDAHCATMHAEAKARRGQLWGMQITRSSECRTACRGLGCRDACGFQANTHLKLLHVAVKRHVDDLKVGISFLQGVVALHQGGCEAAAGRAPVRREVQGYVLAAASAGLYAGSAFEQLLPNRVDQPVFGAHHVDGCNDSSKRAKRGCKLAASLLQGQRGAESCCNALCSCAGAGEVYKHLCERGTGSVICQNVPDGLLRIQNF